MSDDSDNVIPFPSARGWCNAAAQHRWLPAWCDGDYDLDDEPVFGGQRHRIQFWWCDVCNQRGMTTSAPAEDHAKIWAVWSSARWAVYAGADGTARLSVAERITALPPRSARRLGHVMHFADRRGREAQLHLTGQHRWEADRADELVLVTRGTIHGRAAIFLRRSVVFPDRCKHGPRRRCQRCACELPPAGAAEATQVWRGTSNRPQGFLWHVSSASEAEAVLFCSACVDALLAEADARPPALRGRVVPLPPVGRS